MALNNFTDNEAIEIAIALRDRLELNPELPWQERWREKDALAQVINLAEKGAQVAAQEKRIQDALHEFREALLKWEPEKK